MTEDVALPDDGKGKELKELLFVCCATLGPGFPPGHRSSGVRFFARWRHFLWQVQLETEARHATRSTHAGHAACAAGSMIVLEEDPYLALLHFMISARSNGGSDHEQALNPFLVFPISERKGNVLHVIMSGSEVTWDDIERTALDIVRWHGGDTSRVRCVWKGRNEEWERMYWEQVIHRKHIERLRRELPAEADFISQEGVTRIARERKESPDAMRKLFIEDGFSEDENGNFVRMKPDFDEGAGETFALVLRGYAKQLDYTGPLYLSAHSWEQLFYVAAEQQFVAHFKGKRAWYGYLQGIKRLVCIPVHDRFNVAAYTAWELPGDPDFLEAMDDVRIGASNDVDGGTGNTNTDGMTKA